MIWLILLIPTIALAKGPIFTHKQPEQEEFRNIYTEKADSRTTPKIFIGTSAPTFAPLKTGDIFIDTTASKVYVSTATLSSGSWAILN